MKRLLSHLNKKELHSLMVFFLTGLFGASINFLSQIPFKSFLSNRGFLEHHALAWSVFLAYSLATALSFLPAKLFAFSEIANGNSKREWLKFSLIAFLALGVQEMITFWALGRIESSQLSAFSSLHKEKGAHLFGMGFSFMAHFLGHRFFTFRTTGIYIWIWPQKEYNFKRI